MFIHTTSPVTIFPSHADAAAIADCNAADDPDFAYEVVPFGKGFAVLVRDETGAELGVL